MIINLYSSLLIELFSYDFFFFFWEKNVEIIYVLVWIAQRAYVLNNGFRALLRLSTSTKFNIIFIKIGSHSTIHIFKNYFTKVFSVFSNKWYPNRPENKNFPSFFSFVFFGGEFRIGKNQRISIVPLLIMNIYYCLKKKKKNPFVHGILNMFLISKKKKKQHIF